MVVTRFAPSPTGLLHLGNARTALLNKLVARAHGGRFLLRIEDTDKKRSRSDFQNAILEDLHRLGLDHDGEFVIQSTRHARHLEAAESLLKSGAAFRCYLDEKSMESASAKSQKSGAAFRSPYRDGHKPSLPQAEPAIRLRAPDKGMLSIDDKIHGRVSVPATQIDDYVLVRSDGSPTYMLSVVVDDHDMGVTHIVRGEDHMVSAFRQDWLYKALGWSTPAVANVPLIFDESGNKLSKRAGLGSVRGLFAQGYLPQAVASYLMGLGWSGADDQCLSIDEAARKFRLEDLSVSPARLSLDKLANINMRAMRDMDPDALWHALREFADKDSPDSGASHPILKTLREFTDKGSLESESSRRVLKLYQGRAETLKALAAFLHEFRQALSLPPKDEKARMALDGAEVPRLLLGSRCALTDVREWSLEAIGDSLREVARTHGVGFGRVARPLRAAVLRDMATPDLVESLAALGQGESLKRLDEAERYLAQHH